MSDTEKKEISPGTIAAVVFGSILIILIMVFAMMPKEGKAGGDCFKDGSCYAGLRCKSQKCVVIDKGKLGGECRDNGGCNGDLVCNKYGFCEDVKKPATSGGGKRYKPYDPRGWFK
jgi:hypothetical protein